jgi:rare lipoprotein A (peptidoglycan hydrolase)
VIDLSRAAAETLDLVRRGVARVRVEVLEYGPKSKKKKRRRRR